MHRVQRVPVTESQGRIHTSAAGVLVMPEADPVEVSVEPSDVRVDVFRSSGPGGQSVNTTDSAVRITHLPTGIVVSCQNEKSQLQNKEQAMRILRARLLTQAQEQADAQASAERKSQVSAVDRSQRVRTYNFPENRISDHRVGYKAYNLDQVLDGDLDAVIGALEAADRAEKIAESGRARLMNLLLDEVAVAASRLAEAGVESPRTDAELIAAHVHGVARGALHTVPDAAFDPRYWDDVARRASREPLQHITGLAYFRYLELEVGPGVFVPRPETEVMTGWAIEALGEMDTAEPVVADLGTGSGAIALAIAQEVPGARVHAVEADPLARQWAERNVARCERAAPHTAGRVTLHAERLRDRAARPGRRGRPGDQQSAIHPGRRLGAAGGRRVRPGHGAVGRHGRARRDPGDRAHGPAAAAPRRPGRGGARRAAGRGGLLGVRRGKRLARDQQPHRPGGPRPVRQRHVEG